MRPRLEKTYQDVTSRLPPAVAGRIDLLRPSYRAPWGGPLNGQERRCEIVRQLALAIRFDRVLETGTCRGTSTKFFRAVFGAPVQTVENDARRFAYSRGRLSVSSAVTVEFGDSRVFLARLAARGGAKTEAVFLYLDAHWEDDLPLAGELQIIASAFTRCVVMIDDFQIPGDAGYGYDDYGPGRALTEEYLPASLLAGWSLLYPSAPSEEETGQRRGCCVLSSAALAADADVPGLRLSRVF